MIFQVHSSGFFPRVPIQAEEALGNRCIDVRGIERWASARCLIGDESGSRGEKESPTGYGAGVVLS